MGRRLTLSFVLVFVVTATAAAGVFGPPPRDLTARAHGGPSGSPAISGDDRTVRYAAFHSFADNLVGGDTNGTQDVFVYSRFTGKIIRASVSSKGKQANGASANPALDGGIHHSPHCVAFQSQATNLAPGDRDRSWDIYVRNLDSRKTKLVSKGIGPSAVDPAIDGACHQIVFTAGGRVFVGNAGGGKPRFLAKGTNPDVSRDGSAIVWERGHGVFIRRLGHVSQVAAIGGSPHVSDETAGKVWGVAFDTPARLVRGDRNSDFDVYMRVFKASGPARKTVLISSVGGRSSIGGTNHNGGITAYAPIRGIIVFTNTRGPDATLYYSNLHSRNIDDLFHASSDGSTPPITDVASSARANYVTFASNGDVYFKLLSKK